MRCKRLGFGRIGIFFFAVLFAAAPSAADWRVYVAGDLGISGAEVDTDGAAGALATPVPFSGSDNDASPLIAGAIGMEIPMDEIVPREWLGDIRMPNWPVRMEIEGAGLRQYEFKTKAGGEDFFTEVETNTFFTNFWLDVPMTSAYRPVQYLLGLGRQPRVRRWLDPMSFYFGAGVGFHSTDFDGTSNVFAANDDVLDFAWNAGTGLSYAVTNRVSLSAGYRYVGIDSQTIDFKDNGAPINAGDDIDYETDIHEFRFQVRVRVFEFLSPWR